MHLPIILDPASEQLRNALDGTRRLELESGGVVPHWQRSQRLGAPLIGPNPDDVIERGASLLERTGRLERVLSDGASVLDRVATIAHNHDYRLIVADADGVVVHAAAGGQFRDEARRVRLIEGAHWNETLRGTNAIGTALATEQAVFVRGTAHYAQDYCDLVCYAAPVRSPDGRIVAVLDATSFFELDDASMGFGVLAAAQALEEVLRVYEYAHAGTAVSRALARSLGHMRCPVALVEPPGRIVRLNSAARGLFGDSAIDTPFTDLIGIPFDRLRALATAGEDIEVVVTGRPHRLRCEPIESRGRLVALLAILEPTSQRMQVGRANADPTTVRPFDGLFTEDQVLQENLAWAARVAASEIPVILLAETGSGKDLVATGIHRGSRRAEGPFVAVNCGSIAPALLESELFGYGAGSFTGADRQGRNGYLDAATGGTLFLDEVGEMSVAMQASLLRVLETGIYRRVGETTTRTADVRVLCATSRDLERMVEDGTFRQDLFFRLKGAIVRLPPLRDRTDIVALARHLLVQASPPKSLSDEVESRLSSCAWPGNVRELKSTLEVAVLLAGDEDVIQVEHLPPDLARPATASSNRGEANPREPDSTAPTPADEDERALTDVERDAARRALEMHDGNVSRAAKQLGVARSTLYRIMRRHGLGQGEG